MRVVALALVVLAGCAGSAGVSAPVPAKRLPAGEEQRAKALKSAADYCRQNGLVLQTPGSAGKSGRPLRSASGEVPFRCVEGR